MATLADIEAEAVRRGLAPDEYRLPLREQMLTDEKNRIRKFNMGKPVLQGER